MRLGSDSIAVIGLGRMGAAIANTLALSGLEVRAWNRSESRGRELICPEVSFKRELAAALEADVIMLVLSDYRVSLQVLQAHAPALAGRTVVNLATGSREEARGFSAFASAAGARYLAGVIHALPEGVGGSGSVINCAGDRQAWDEVEPAILTLAGKSAYLGADVTLPAVVDAAMTGGFFNVAVGAFLQAVAFANAAGVPFQAIAPTAISLAGGFQPRVEQMLASVASNAFETDQASLDVYLAAVRIWHDEMVAGGSRVTLMTANRENLERAVELGLGHLGLEAQFLVMGETDQAAL